MPIDTGENKHPILPQLKDGHQIANFKTSGMWDHRSWQEAKTLYEGLKVEGVEFQVNSIPDVWARPVLFEMALYNPGPVGRDDLAHPLHRRVRGEWRGLLALFALREWRGINDLAVTQVFGAAAAAPDFLRVAEKLKPSKSLSVDTRWLDIHVILLGRHPIAITSPTTLVCTATDYVGRIDRERVPWFNGQYLDDPTLLLSPEERRGVAAWLHRLQMQMTGHVGLLNTSREWNELLFQLQAYVAELGGVPGGTYESNTAGLDLQTGIFIYLQSALIQKPGDPLDSDVRLLPTRVSGFGVAESDRRGLRMPHWLVVDERIASEWRTPMSEVTVWGRVPLSVACADIKSNTDRGRLAGRALANAVWVKPEDIFLDRLCLIRQANALPGSFRDSDQKDPTGADQLVDQNNQRVTALVPLKPGILDYLSPSEVAGRLTFSAAGDAVIVRLRLPLAGFQLKGKDFTIVRAYSFAEKEIIIVDDLPVVEVWPNFKTAAWGTYYCYYSNTGNAGMFHARPYAIETSAVTRKLKNYEITQMARFPEAMLCSIRSPVDSETSQDVGLILLDPPTDVQPVQQLTWRLGVDFGTTGTRLYYRQGVSSPQPIIFHARSREVTGTGQRGYTYSEFLPSQDEPTDTLLSLFHDFRTATWPPSPILDGHVYFIKDYLNFNANQSEIAKNMKWGQERERTLAELFLQQLCLQAAAEAAAKGVTGISWRFSFPASFSQADRGAFSQIWRGIARSSAVATGMHQSSALQSSDESTAAARFFAHSMSAPLHRGTVCIDIGGGTSDIAVWQKDNRLLCQSSVRLAGRDIFLYPIYVWPDFLRSYFSQPVESLITAKKNNDTDAFYAQADAILKAFGDGLLNELPKKHANAKVKEFLGLIESGLCGLFYYVGLMLKALNKQNRYDAHMPNIYLGGNAAKLLHWCAFGQFTKGSDIDTRLKTILLRAADFTTADTLEQSLETFSIEMSVEPKAEVAYGLLIDEQFVTTAGGSQTAHAADEEQQPIMAGEAFTEGGNTRTWEDLLTAGGMHRGVVLGSALHNFEAFLGCLHPKSDLSTALRQRLVERTNNDLINDSKRPEEQIRLQPLFIGVLKHYLTWRAETWAAGKATASGGQSS